MHRISSKLWGNTQDYGLYGYYKIQVAKDKHINMCMKLLEL